ncbi:MAG: hypothetical protein P4M11_10735 [Candidatus Pacebacteria bacterium]|nr:hypothetical protein [Candidatus Paceibacterota bacterium]
MGVECPYEGCGKLVNPELIKLLCQWSSCEVLDVAGVKAERLADVNNDINNQGARALIKDGKVNLLALTQMVKTIGKSVAENLSMNEDNEKIEFPDYWEHKYDSQKSALIDVPAGDPVFAHIQARFQQTVPNVPLKRVQRVQAIGLWKRYAREKKRLEKANGAAYVNEQELFHGTSTIDPRNIYEGDQGFDTLFASINGTRGGGNYFAPNASYSNNGYAHEASDGHKLFFVKVVLGHVSEVVDANKLMPPIRIGNIRYDSVRNKGDMYIVYNNEKSYPAYLFTY